MKTLTFQNTTLTPVKTDNQIWLSSADLAKALGYSQSRAVSKLYNENQDEFTPSMTALIPNPHMKNANIRIFSLKGCHLIAMFARTAVAKEFRKWVLDILDKEVGAPVQCHTISVEQQAQIRHAIAKRCKSNREHYQSVYTALHQEFNIPRYSELLAVDFERAMAFINDYRIGVNTDALILAAQYLSWHMHFIHSWFSAIYPYFRAISPKLCGEIHGHILDAQCFAKSIHHQVGFRDMNVDVLKKKTWSVNQ